MKVPNYHNSYIPAEKIEEYLLSRTHPIGNVTGKIKTQYGIKYIVKGTVGRRFGKAVAVVTIWLIEEGTSFPRFITAYPDR